MEFRHGRASSMCLEPSLLSSVLHRSVACNHVRCPARAQAAPHFASVAPVRGCHTCRCKDAGPGWRGLRLRGRLVAAAGGCKAPPRLQLHAAGVRPPLPEPGAVAEFVQGRCRLLGCSDSQDCKLARIPMYPSSRTCDCKPESPRPVAAPTTPPTPRANDFCDDRIVYGSAPCVRSLR